MVNPDYLKGQMIIYMDEFFLTANDPWKHKYKDL